jgi:hypothetical protein
VSADNHVHQDHASTAADLTTQPPESTANPDAGARRRPPDVPVVSQILVDYSVTWATDLIFRFLWHSGEEPYPECCPDCGFAVECESGCENHTYQLVNLLRELMDEVHVLLGVGTSPGEKDQFRPHEDDPEWRVKDALPKWWIHRACGATLAFVDAHGDHPYPDECPECGEPNECSRSCRNTVRRTTQKLDEAYSEVVRLIYFWMQFVGAELENWSLDIDLDTGRYLP